MAAVLLPIRRPTRSSSCTCVTGVEWSKRSARELHARGIRVMVSGVDQETLAIMERVGLVELLASISAAAPVLYYLIAGQSAEKMLNDYQHAWLRTDLIAGLTVVALLSPEGMTYAQLAGVPPEAAFYAAHILIRSMLF